MQFDAVKIFLICSRLLIVFMRIFILLTLSDKSIPFLCVQMYIKIKIQNIYSYVAYVGNETEISKFLRSLLKLK